MAMQSFPVRVQLFARYAELLGSHLVEVRVPEGATVADVVAGVRSLPGGSALPSRVLVARKHEQVRGDHPVISGDELAFLPPMSGG